jgi:crotonobetainyl-CoA:carnitine CoA-transferase CaiB-like acyl-CoA transferase
VLELATGVAGPYGGRLLALLGATVVKIEPEGGDPARTQPSDHGPAADPSDLFVHLAAGKRLVKERAVDLGAALGWADGVIASGVRSELAGTALDPARLASRPHPRLLVTTSAWAFDTRERGEIADELLVQAQAGVLSTTGDPDGPPLRFPGFVAQAMTGAYVAAATLAGLRRPGTRHVHVPWAWAIASGVEAGWSRQLQVERRDRPAGAHPPELYPSGALPCRDGFVAPGTIRPFDWVAQCRAYGRPDLLDDERFRSRERRARSLAALWSEIAPWYAARDRRAIFETALERGWALGMVLRASDALEDPHLAARGFLCDVSLPGGERARLPIRPWLAPGLPAAPARLAAAGEDDRWFAARVGEPREPAPPRTPLDRLRVLELTQAWAGPFVGRFLGALGADVVKVESAERPDGWRAIVSFKQMAPYLARDPAELSVEINANYNSINRNKRHCSLDLAREEGRALFLELVRVADAVVANMTARVLPNLRLDFAALRRVNPRIVLIQMPALGASGPYRDAAGYGSIVEGMGGFGALFGAPEEGARISQTFFPDPVAGIHATVALLSMLERRERTGEGGEVDLSQQEALWLLLGESIAAASRGRDPARLGNAMPGVPVSGVFRARNGEWVAVLAPARCRELVEQGREIDADAWIERLRAEGARAVRVLHYAEARHGDAMRGALEELVHPVTERRPYLRVPLLLDGAPVDSRRPSPLFDQHTREVLRDWLGLSDARIDAALATGAAGGAPDPAALRASHLARARAAANR